MNKKNNTLVWQFYPSVNTGNEVGEIENPSYIIGTMHVRDARAFQFEQIFFDKIQACEVFATEFDLEDAQIAPVENAMLLPQNETLK